jgi:hypothetical protein
MGGDSNLFAYASRDPINFVDLDGEETGTLPGTRAEYRIDWNQQPRPNMHVTWPDGSESVINHEGGWDKTHGGRQLVKPPKKYRKALRPIVKKFVKKAGKAIPVIGVFFWLADAAEAAQMVGNPACGWTDFLNFVVPYKDVLSLIEAEE